MGRRSNSDKWIYLDVNKYSADLGKALNKVMEDINRDMLMMVKARAEALPFKSHNVYIAGEKPTSDAERRGAFLASIKGYVDKKVTNLKKGVIGTVVTAMEDNFKDSHIGLYYEYGTGTLEESNSPLPYMGEWNEYRNGGVPMAGARIVTRQHEMFTDAGGNVRISNSRVPGMPIKTPGWEVQAHHWYREAYDKMRETYFNKIVEAVNSINPVGKDYLKVRTEINLGR
jgi:hypothetical protein